VQQGLNNTSGKVTTSVVDTCEKFTTGVNDTGGGTTFPKFKMIAVPVVKLPFWTKYELVLQGKSEAWCGRQFMKIT
jgi:hypothetical protein